MARRVAGLLFAARTEEGPFGPQRAKRGSKGRGLAYERAVGAALPRAATPWEFNPWFEFLDANGKGFAQPDYILLGPREVFLLECKLTDTPEAYEQINFLYRPILEHVFALPVRGVVVCKNLAPHSPASPYVDLTPALRAARAGETPTLHWLGHSKLR
jgi:hypothetical protein